MEETQQDNPETLKISTSSNQHHFPKTVFLGIAALLITSIALGIGYYLGVNNSQLTSMQKNQQPQINSTPTPIKPASAASDSQQVLKPGTYQKTSAISPDKFGFTKIVELKVIGVKAKFPQDVNISLQQENFYVAKVGSDDTVTFALKEYDGTGRRAWFQKEYVYYKDYDFVTFNGLNHSGYIIYLKNPQDNYSGSYFYLTAVNSSKMLVISGSNNIHGTIFFGGDFDKFKSFLSTVELTATQNVLFENFPTSDLYRSSDTRKTVWEDISLGIKITAPEWIESRYTRERDSEGKFTYTDWSRIYPEAKAYDSSYFSEPVKSVNVTGAYASSLHLNILSSKYQDDSFSDVANKLLIPAGFCTTEWQNNFYTKQDVIKNLIIKKQIKIGALDAQLRNMNQDFSYKYDCRSDDTWLIKGKNNQYVISNIFPDNEVIRIEVL